ncbi:MAG: RecB family exonuclease [Planctomycetota bacterium]|jgi:RecB family exonuclease
MKAFPTAIETYRNCPRKWSFDRDPEIKRKYRQPTQALYVGMCIHDALERFFDPMLTPRSDRTYERLVNELRAAWGGKYLSARRARERREERKKLFGDDRATEGAVGEKAKHLLHRFFQTQDLEAVPYTAEQFHEIPLGKHTLAGKVDRVDKLDDGTLKVVDYKTGKGKTVKQLRRDDLQLAIYAMVVGRKFGIHVSKCSMIYLKDDVEVGFEPDEAWLAEKEAEVVALLDRMAVDEECGPTPNVLCGWCDYRPLCPEGRQYLDDQSGASPEDAEDVPF